MKSRVRATARWSLAVLIGLVLGVGVAVLVLTGRVLGSGGEHVGAWNINVDVGSDQGGPYVRAVTATQGLLALSRQEAVYFVALEDDDGRRLAADCSYELSGSDFAATWWSITAYDGAYLAENDDDHPSVDATGVERAPDGSWTARLAPSRGGVTNWLSTADNDSPNLLLRLYVPQESVLDDPSTVDVPTIRRIDCEGER